MLKVEIEINEEKVLIEGRYDLDKMYEILDAAFDEYGIIKIGKGVYRDTGSKKDWGNMWCVILALSETDWFMDNASKLMWYNSNRGNDENDFYHEDVLQGFKDDGKKVKH